MAGARGLFFLGFVLLIIGIVVKIIGGKKAKKEKKNQSINSQPNDLNSVLNSLAQNGIYVDPYTTSAGAQLNGVQGRGFTGFRNNCGQQIYFSTYDVIPQPYPHGTCPYCHNWVAVF